MGISARATVLLVAGSPLFSTSLRAEGSAVEFRASGPDCPAATHVQGLISRLLGRGVESRGRATIEVTKIDAGYRARVSVELQSGHVGERTFVAETCELAADASAVIVAISLFPERASELAQKADADVAFRTGPMSREPHAEHETIEREVRFEPTLWSEPRERVSVWFGAGFDANSLPSPAVELGLGIETAIAPRWLVAIAGSAAPDQTVFLSSGARARLSLWSLSGHACYRAVREPIALDPCFGVRGFRLAGEGEGVDHPRDGTTLYGGPSLGIAGRWAATRGLGLRVYAETFVPVVRRQFVLDGVDVHRPSAVGLVIFFGPTISF